MTLSNWTLNPSFMAKCCTSLKSRRQMKLTKLSWRDNRRRLVDAKELNSYFHFRFASWFPKLISCSPNLPRVYIRLCKHGNHFTFLQSRLAFQVLLDFLRGILVMHWSALPVLGECLLQRKRSFTEISHRVNLSLYPFETRALR